VTGFSKGAGAPFTLVGSFGWKADTGDRGGNGWEPDITGISSSQRNSAEIRAV